MASPTCTVDGVATTNGVDVASADNVTIALADVAGVKTWTVSCIGTDENTTPANVMGSLDIDSVTKTALFQSPDSGIYGCAMIWLSTVTDNQDNVSTATFGIYVVAGNGARIAALNETYEGNAAVGWTSVLNAAARGAGGTSSVAATADTIVKRDGAGAAFATALQTNAITSPNGTDIRIQPGLADDGVGGYSAGTVRNTYFWAGLGNPAHGGQAGAITYNNSNGLIWDWHGVGVVGDAYAIKRWVFGFGSAGGGAYAYDVSVDHNIAGALSFNLSGSNSLCQVILYNSNAIGYRVYDAAGSGDTANLFQVTPKGVSIGGLISTSQTGSVQWATVTQASAPAAGHAWSWFDGTNWRFRLPSGDDFVLVTQIDGSSNRVIDIGPIVSNVSKRFAVQTSAGTICSIGQSSASNVDFHMGSGLGCSLSCSSTFSVAAGNNVISLQSGTQYVNAVGTSCFLDSDSGNCRTKAGVNIISWSATAGAGVAVTRCIYTPRQTLTASSGTLTVDMSLSNVVQITYSGSFTLAFSNLKDGGRYTLIFIHDATANSYTVTLPSTIKTSGGITQPTQSTGAKDIIDATSDGTNLYVAAYAKNLV